MEIKFRRFYVYIFMSTLNGSDLKEFLVTYNRVFLLRNPGGH